jgi:hypothetical protein
LDERCCGSGPGLFADGSTASLFDAILPLCE